MITAAGAGSGLDIENIVNQLIALEEQPVNALRQRRAGVNVQISDYGSLKSTLGDLESVIEKLGDESRFGAFVAESSDEDVFTVETLDGTQSHNHSINVISLATAHRMVSDPYASSSDTVAAGDYTFGSGDESFTISLADGDNSLLNFASLINNSTDNTTIEASVLNVADGSRLVLTARNAGVDNIITAPAGYTELTAASDAQFEIDGLAATSSTNTVTDVAPDLSIELKAIGSADIVSNRNTESIVELLEEFATGYNEMNSTISRLSQGSLDGESLTRRIQTAVRNDFFANIVLDESSPADSHSIFNNGLTFDKTGQLSVDRDRLDDAISTNSFQLQQIFTDPDNGFAARLESTLNRFTELSGAIDTRTDSLEANGSSIDDNIDRLELRLEQTEIRYRRQFGAMDTLIARLQSNGDYLVQQLASLNN
jgi:flagellar hook-associated protein 2